MCSLTPYRLLDLLLAFFDRLNNSGIRVALGVGDFYKPPSFRAACDLCHVRPPFCALGLDGPTERKVDSRSHA